MICEKKSTFAVRSTIALLARHRNDLRQRNDSEF
jgi:hypothetical protein